MKEVVVARIDRLSDAERSFVADGDRSQKRSTVRVLALGDGERRRNDRRRGVDGGSFVNVVQFEDVRGHAVGECRRRCRSATSAKHRRSFDAPNRAATCRARQAGFSVEPPSAEPSQSVTDRFACSMTVGGSVSYRAQASVSASARVTLDTEIPQPLDDDCEIHRHIDDAKDEAEHPEVLAPDVSAP
jgi:hypothetical protein